MNVLNEIISAARGESKADLVIKGAKYFDVFGGEFLNGDVAVKDGVIIGTGADYEGLTEIDVSDQGFFIVPGFIDAHVHIESSMMIPSRFQEAVLPCGTTSVIWDPHEIANVKGVDGINWALESSAGLLLDVFVMVPSCVPSTSPEMRLETSGAELRSSDIVRFKSHDRVLGLGEMMNFPGLLFQDKEVLAKLEAFSGMKVDGHCPGLSGKDLNAYKAAGISTCHESITFHEAREKLSKGIHVLIREGSCAKNADELLPILKNTSSSSEVGLCSDDRNPADIADEGHINFIVNKALKSGIHPWNIFRASSFATAKAYGLNDRGAIAPGFLADFCLIRPKKGSSWKSGIEICQVFKTGKLIDQTKLNKTQVATKKFEGKNINLGTGFRAAPKDFEIRVSSTEKTETGQQEVRVIGVISKQIVTESLTVRLKIKNGLVESDPHTDILKIAVFERHRGTGQRSVGFIHGFSLKAGAIATSVNHDCHNIIVVGANDDAMASAVNRIQEIDGGIVVVGAKGEITELPLPYGGLMTDVEPARISLTIKELKKSARRLGCKLDEPFLTLSFMALPVIPSLKLTDVGLVDGTRLNIISVLKQ